MSLNLYGNDINLLVKLLEEKLYIREKWVSKKEGLLLYDGKVEAAVKHFQKDAGGSMRATHRKGAFRNSTSCTLRQIRACPSPCR